MAQADLIIENQTFPAFRSDLNNNIQALGTCQSGPSAPTTTYPCMLWADTTTNLLKQRNTGNTAWITIGRLDTTYLVTPADIGATTSAGVDTLINARTRAIATRTTDLAVSTQGSWIDLSFNSATTNPGSEFNAGTSTFTAAAAGTYQVSLNATVIASGGTIPTAILLLLGLSVNGTDRIIATPYSARNYVGGFASIPVTLASGGTVKPRYWVEVTGGSGFSLNVQGTSNQPIFQVERKF